MSCNINQTKPSESDPGLSVCTRKFEVPEGQIENSYLCGQPRFTISGLWNVQKQKRQFTRRDYKMHLS